MKQRELFKRLRKAAEGKGRALEFVRHGGRHDIYRFGGFHFPVPRHTDIPEPTARKIIKEVEEL